MSLALSTAWNATVHRSGKAIVSEIAELGFKSIELGFNLTPAILKDIIAEASQRKIKITSLHNYCPIPDGLTRKAALPDCLSLSSPDGFERDKAVKYTKRSIDTAASTGANTLVMHCGRVEIEDQTRRMIRLFRRGAKVRLNKLRDEYRQERRANSAPYLASILRSLEELNRYASRLGVSLGIETRFYHREIPSFEETGMILNRFKGSAIYYWHDTGHAEVSEKLGFYKHQDFLDAYAGRMLGIHLHDVKLCEDHLVPGQGEIDFNRFKPYLKDTTKKVVEAHYPASASQVKQGKSYLEEILHV